MNKLINTKSPRKSSKNSKSQGEDSNPNPASNNASTSAEPVALIPHVPVMSRKLTLLIKEASKLGDAANKSHYIQIDIGNEVRKTDLVAGENPQWNQVFVFENTEESFCAMLEIKDENETLLGKLEVPVTKFGIVDRERPMRNDERQQYCVLSVQTNFVEEEKAATSSQDSEKLSPRVNSIKIEKASSRDSGISKSQKKDKSFRLSKKLTLGGGNDKSEKSEKSVDDGEKSGSDSSRPSATISGQIADTSVDSHSKGNDKPNAKAKKDKSFRLSKKFDKSEKSTDDASTESKGGSKKNKNSIESKSRGGPETDTTSASENDNVEKSTDSDRKSTGPKISISPRAQLEVSPREHKPEKNHAEKDKSANSKKNNIMSSIGSKVHHAFDNDEKEKLEKEKLEKEKLEKERVEKEKQEKEKQEKEKQEKEKQEKERIEKDKQEKDKQEKDKQEKERIEKETQERIENERIEKERKEQERLEIEKITKRRLEKERIESEMLELDRIQKEEAEKAEKDRIEKERIQQMFLERKKFEKEKLEKELIEEEIRAQEKREEERKERRRLELEKEKREEEERLKLAEKQQQQQQQQQQTAEKPQSSENVLIPSYSPLNNKPKYFSPDSTVVNKDADFVYKIIVVGNSGVGKTSILKRWVRDEFDAHTTTTICSESYGKSYDVKGSTVTFHIWDTAGQEKFRSLTNSFYRGSHGVIVVYDITTPQSFESVERWLEDVETFATEFGRLKILLVGNKSDGVSKRMVTINEGNKLAMNKEMYFMETSALTGDHVQEAIQILLNEIHQPEKLEKSTEAVSNINKGTVLKKDKKEPIMLKDENSVQATQPADGDCAC